MSAPALSLWPEPAAVGLWPAEPRWRRRRDLPRTFRAWNEQFSPAFTWHWPHLALLQDTLERVTRGEIPKLLIEMPPRHGKSETTTIRYPVYRLALRPELRVIVGAYNHTLAEKFSRKARALAARAGIPLSKERQAAHDWETTAGGGVRAVGVGTGVTGHGGDLIIIDDPVKSREEAESVTYRERVWAWYTDDLYTRREPGAAEILILTRWHEDDLAGRILASEDGANWTRLRLPAFAETEDPLGRAEGAALCPDRYDEAALAGIRTVMGEYGFSALYQQRPTPRSGNMFPRAKATIVKAAPAGTVWCRFWDKAGVEGGGKYTAGVKIGRTPEGRYIVGDVQRAQYEAGARRRLMVQTAQLDGRGVKIRVEQEPGSGGKESAEADVRALAGFDVAAKPASGDKVTRADPFAAQWQAGNVDLLEGEWNKPYLDELETWPNGKYLDQGDASAGAFNEIALGSTLRVMVF